MASPHKDVQEASKLAAAPLPAQPAWIEPGILLKGGSMLLGGPAAIGKSLALFDIADSLSRGAAALFGHGGFLIPAAARVLYVEREIGLYGVQKRLHERTKALGYLPADDWYVVARSSRYNPATHGGLLELKALVADLGIDVLMLDPAGRFLANDISGPEVAQLFDHLDQLQADFPELAYILSHHFAQQPRSDQDRQGWDELSPENFRGSTRWHGSVDTKVMCARRDAPGDPARWYLDTRWLTRHQEDPGDIRIAVEQNFTLRVRGVAPAPQAQQSGRPPRRRPKPSRQAPTSGSKGGDHLSALIARLKQSPSSRQ
jgi:hypothetical protein